MGYAMNEMWNAIRAMKGQKGGGKGKGFQCNCERCGKYGRKAKEFWSSRPAREVGEEEKSEIDWACMIDEEAQYLNAADEEKQSCAEFDARGLSEHAKNQVEERKKRWSSRTQEKAAIGRESNPSEALAAGERKGLEPKWRKKIDGGYRLRFVMDSGAAKTIVPREAIPGMRMGRSKRVSFRMANGNVIPNLGETEIKGLGAVNSHPHKFGTQVADVTKPLAGRWENNHPAQDWRNREEAESRIREEDSRYHKSGSGP